MQTHFAFARSAGHLFLSVIRPAVVSDARQGALRADPVAGFRGKVSCAARLLRLRCRHFWRRRLGPLLSLDGDSGGLAESSPARSLVRRLISLWRVDGDCRIDSMSRLWARRWTHLPIEHGEVLKSPTCGREIEVR